MNAIRPANQDPCPAEKAADTDKAHSGSRGPCASAQSRTARYPVTRAERRHRIRTGATAALWIGQRSRPRSTSDDARIPFNRASCCPFPRRPREPAAELQRDPHRGSTADRKNEVARYAIDKRGRQRAGEYHRRIGQAEGDVQNAGGAAPRVVNRAVRNFDAVRNENDGVVDHAHM